MSVSMSEAVLVCHGPRFLNFACFGLWIPDSDMSSDLDSETDSDEACPKTSNRDSANYRKRVSTHQRVPSLIQHCPCLTFSSISASTIAVGFSVIDRDGFDRPTSDSVSSSLIHKSGLGLHELSELAWSSWFGARKVLLK